MIWIVAAILLPTLLGLALALLLDFLVKGANIFKSIFLSAHLSVGHRGRPDLDMDLSARLGHPEFLAAFGKRHHGDLRLLAKPGSALYAVIVAWSTPEQTGLAMVIFLAGLTAIPPDLTEAADMEGAMRLQRIRHVVLPLL